MDKSTDKVFFSQLLDFQILLKNYYSFTLYYRAIFFSLDTRFSDVKQFGPSSGPTSGIFVPWVLLWQWSDVLSKEAYF